MRKNTRILKIITVSTIAAALLLGNVVLAAVPSGWSLARKASSEFDEMASYQGKSNVVKQSVSSADFNAAEDLARLKRGTYDNHQGYASSTPSSGDTWKVNTSLYISSDMLSGTTAADRRNTGVWAETNDGKWDYYSIISFMHQNPSNFYSDTGYQTGWYYWDDVAVDYKPITTNASALTVGWHTVDLQSVAMGIVDYYIDGVKVHTENYNTDRYSDGAEYQPITKFWLTKTIITSYNFGSDYSVYWQLPVVTSPSGTVPETPGLAEPEDPNTERPEPGKEPGAVPTDAATGVSITSDVIKSNGKTYGAHELKFTVNKKTVTDEDYTKYNTAETLQKIKTHFGSNSYTGINIVHVLDMSLYASGTNLTTFEDGLVVKVPYDTAKYGTDHLFVMYLGDNGEVEILPAKVTEPGYIEFTIYHLSEYVVAQGTTANTEANPNTGDLNLIIIFASTLAAVIIGIIIVRQVSKRKRM